MTPAQHEELRRLGILRSALEEAGIPCDPGLVRYDDFTHRLAHQHALELLESPTAELGFPPAATTRRVGISRAAASLGLRLPDYVGVVGFDDLPFAEWVTPCLTTVRTPLADVTPTGDPGLPSPVPAEDRTGTGLRGIVLSGLTNPVPAGTPPDWARPARMPCRLREW
ncbi:substrate-binding domain-containing protein [Streptomyces sp. NPDC000618]|uniref:substrate-binding domain-containing protein n=1 Tax=Streptomyces sp. NPDC000618 TaxID=3154265 RepID=UPI003322492A